MIKKIAWPLGLLIAMSCSGAAPKIVEGEATRKLGYEESTLDDAFPDSMAGYRVVAIDGEEENRRKAGFTLISYKPVVRVTPGWHVVSLVKTNFSRNQGYPERASLKHLFKEGVGYVIELKEGTVIIAEHEWAE